MFYFRQYSHKSISSKVPVGQRQGHEEMSHVALWRKNILIEGNVGGKALRRSKYTTYFKELQGKQGYLNEATKNKNGSRLKKRHGSEAVQEYPCQSQ